MGYEQPGPWKDKEPGTAACLHFGAVDVVVLTGEVVSRLCPACGGAQYVERH